LDRHSQAVAFPNIPIFQSVVWIFCGQGAGLQSCAFWHKTNDNITQDNLWDVSRLGRSLAQRGDLSSCNRYLSRHRDWPLWQDRWFSQPSAAPTNSLFFNVGSSCLKGFDNLPTDAHELSSKPKCL
jgi:hypothetical protein